MYIKKLIINNVRHLKNLDINIGEEKKHLILTGKNGSGKTSILEFLNKAILTKLSMPRPSDSENKTISSLYNGKDLLANVGNLDKLDLHFIYSFLKDYRKLVMDEPKGPTKNDFHVNAQENKKDVTTQFVQILVDMKVMEVFAERNGASEKATKLMESFERIEKLFKEIFQDSKLKLHFNYENYSFDIIQEGKKFSIFKLSAGYATALMIVVNLVLKCNIVDFDGSRYGIVLIDEVENHLHISLQKKILPMLDLLFPNIQFIVTTHSPFIITSLENAVVYDLENQILLDDLTSYSYESIVEDYFDNNQYSEVIINKIARYEELESKKESLSLEEKVERDKILNYLESQLKSDELISKIKSIIIKNKGTVNK